jgi:hypothetical protein
MHLVDKAGLEILMDRADSAAHSYSRMLRRTAEIMAFQCVDFSAYLG